MRVGILANSYLAAFRIYDQLKDLPDYEFFIVLSPSPRRAPWLSVLANLARMTMSSLTTPGWQLSRLPFNRRVIFLLRPIDDADSVAQLKKLNLDVGLHKSGVIYRDNTIKAFSLGILNPHIGVLPAYRGRNVMEWSLLNGDPVGVSVFFIDTGIDTGSRIVVSEEVDISKFKSIPKAKQHLFDLDAMFFRKALVSLRSENPVYGVNDGSGRRHYVMSQLFQGVVQDLMLVNN